MKLQEKEILLIELILQGKTNLEIAELFDYSESSVKKMLTKTYKKFQVSSRIELINFLLNTLKFEIKNALKKNITNF